MVCVAVWMSESQNVCTTASAAVSQWWQGWGWWLEKLRMKIKREKVTKALPWAWAV